MTTIASGADSRSSTKSAFDILPLAVFDASRRLGLCSPELLIFAFGAGSGFRIASSKDLLELRSQRKYPIPGVSPSDGVSALLPAHEGRACPPVGAVV